MSFNVLLSSGGRRVGLLQAFRDALADGGVSGSVFVADAAATAPAAFLAERSFRVPRCADPAFAETVLDLCRQHGIKLVVPTIDTELAAYAEARERFAEAGIAVAVSDPATVAVCADKRRTHCWLVSQGFPTVRQASVGEVLMDSPQWAFPVIAKPARGSASQGVRRIASAEELRFLSGWNELMVEEIAPGQEYTINIYVDRKGRCLAAVPHLRLEVRGGEVSKGITVRHSGLMELGQAIAEALPGAFGALNVQCFVDGREVRIIEINARFGGGYPLTHRAGARFASWLVGECLGCEQTPFDSWSPDVAMLRYDEAVYVSADQVRAAS